LNNLTTGKNHKEVAEKLMSESQNLTNQLLRALRKEEELSKQNEYLFDQLNSANSDLSHFKALHKEVKREK